MDVLDAMSYALDGSQSHLTDWSAFQRERKEDILEIVLSFTGGVSLVDGHFVVKAGCETAICHTPKEVAKLIEKQLEEQYKGKYGKKS